MALLTLPQIKHDTDQLGWGNLAGAALPLALSELVRTEPALYLLIVPDTPTALRLEQELAVFLGDSVPLYSFPDWETLPYDQFSPHQDIISQRLRTLYQLPHLTQGLVIVPVSTLMLRLCEHNHLQTQSLVLKKGQRLDLTTLKRQLTQVGYRAVDQVMEHGEFSARGSILDLYPMGATSPYRIDFFDNDVDGIRTFDPDNQRSLAQVEAIELLPAHEFPTDQAAIERVEGRAIPFGRKNVDTDIIIPAKWLKTISREGLGAGAFEALEALKPSVVVPGHGNVTTLAQAQRDTGNLLKALRAHMGKAVEAGTDIGVAVKSFDATPFKHLKHVDVWLPQLANRTYLEMEQE